MRGNSLVGFGVGLAAAAAFIVSMKPAPVITLNTPDVQGSQVVSRDYPYSRFGPLPELNIESGRDRLLQQSVRRVTMKDGTPGVRVTLLIEWKEERRTFFI